MTLSSQSYDRGGGLSKRERGGDRTANRLRKRARITPRAPTVKPASPRPKSDSLAPAHTDGEYQGHHGRVG
jgi:hypothetical protein